MFDMNFCASYLSRVNTQQRLEDLKLNGWGKFGTGFGEFTVTRYHLPRAWDHILGDERLFWRVHHNGKAYLQELPPGGTYWLRADSEQDTPPWQVWIIPGNDHRRAFTNFRGPLAEDLTKAETPGEYTCRWLPERAAMCVKRDGLRVETELGVTATHPLAVMRVTITNTGRRQQSVTVMPQIQPWLTAAQPAAWDMPWLYQSSTYDEATNSIRFEMRDPVGRGQKHRRQLRWMLDKKLDRICLSDTQFRGHGTRFTPAALTDWKRWSRRGDQQIYGKPVFGAFAGTVTLKPGASHSFTMILGDDRTGEAEFRAVLADPENEFRLVREQKLALLQRFKIETPDPAFTRYVNEFLSLQQQLVLHRGWPCNMMGVRDTAQDFTGVVAWNPEASRKMILTILETERTDGWFLRQFSTDGRRGRHDARPYVDSGLWVWELVYEYVCQTRDFGLLEEKIPFLDSDELTSVRDHLARLLGYFLSPKNVGEHGLCKILEGDWNDSVNRAGLAGRGESVMVTCHLIYCLREALKLHQFLVAGGHDGIAGAETFATKTGELRERIRASALNSLGYLNGVFADNGKWFFSPRDPDGHARFNMPVNAFGIIAGIFEPDETRRLITRIRKMRRAYGYPLFSPAIGEPPMEGLGRIGSGDLRPGLGENGTCYNHGCHGFLARALATINAGDLWLDVMQCLFPYDQKNHPVRQAKTAPYAIVNVYRSAPDCDSEGGDTFFSGTIDVALRNIYQGLLGVQAEPTGLSIRPCLPKPWRQISAQIGYAGRTLEIVVTRRGQNYEISVDDQKLSDGFLPA